MIAYILRRILQSVLVMLVVALVSFSLFRFVGDPVATMMGQEASQADREALRDRLGLNDPVTVQFAGFIGRAATGDFGISYRLQQPVMELILSRLPATLELALISGTLAFVFGVGFGVYTALNRRGFLSGTIMTVSLIGVSLPTFLIGVLLIWVFAVELQWLPSFGRGDTVDLGPWRTGLLTQSGRASIVLPAITLGLYQMTLIMRLVRAEMLEVLRSDYIKFARARGLSDRAVQFRPRAQEHAGAGHHHHRAATREHHRLRHHHRDCLPVAGGWRAVHQLGAVRRHPGDGRLSHADRADLRGHQPRRRSALLRRGSAPAGGPHSGAALRRRR